MINISYSKIRILKLIRMKWTEFPLVIITGQKLQNNFMTPTKVETWKLCLTRCACKALVWKKWIKKNHTQSYQRWVSFDNKGFELNKQIGQTFIKVDRYRASQPHLCFDRNSRKHSDWIHEYKQRLWQLVRNFEMEQRPSAKGNEMQPRLSCFLSHCAWAERNSGVRQPLPSPFFSSQLLLLQLYTQPNDGILDVK